MPFNIGFHAYFSVGHQDLKPSRIYKKSLNHQLYRCRLSLVFRYFGGGENRRKQFKTRIKSPENQSIVSVEKKSELFVFFIFFFTKVI